MSKMSSSFVLNVLLTDTNATHYNVQEQIEKNSVEEVKNKHEEHIMENELTISSIITEDNMRNHTNQNLLRLPWKNKKVRHSLNSERRIRNMGIRSMSKTDLVTQTSTALGSILTSVTRIDPRYLLDIMISDANIFSSPNSEDIVKDPQVEDLGKSHSFV